MMVPLLLGHFGPRRLKYLIARQFLKTAMISLNEPSLCKNRLVHGSTALKHIDKRQISLMGLSPLCAVRPLARRSIPWCGRRGYLWPYVSISIAHIRSG